MPVYWSLVRAAQVLVLLAVSLALPTAASASVDGNEIARRLEAKLEFLSPVVDQLDAQKALQSFYSDREYRTLWFDDSGPTRAASEVIGALGRAESWGLKGGDFALPAVETLLRGAARDAESISAAEYELSAMILRYGAEARGARIAEPSRQLSEFIDRRPELFAPKEVLERVAFAEKPGEVLESLHPRHVQFQRLHTLLVALQKEAGPPQSETIALKGPLLVPGASNDEIPRLRRRLAVAPPDGDEKVYDAALAASVKKFQASRSLAADGLIGPATRKALNGNPKGVADKIQSVVASMEEWRWMPADLGDVHLLINIPAFTMELVKDGKPVLSERVIVGKPESQTPIFSKDMTAIVLRPSWYLPDTIKLEKLQAAERRGQSLEDEGIVVKKGSRVVKSWTVNWTTAKLTEYSIFQPSGDGNALGDVKFLFPNRHSVYLHDTPAKGLFEEEDRLFSHGCVRLRNPLQLAQRVFDLDQGAGSVNVKSLVKDGPGSNEVWLQRPIPVHIGYFTVSVDADGVATYSGDPYGHDGRVALALAGKWTEIERTLEKRVPDAAIGLEPGQQDQSARTSEAGVPGKPVRRASLKPADEFAPEKGKSAAAFSVKRASTRGSVGEMMNAAFLR